MWHDPLVAEIHQTRERIALKYGNDIHAICEAARCGELSKVDPGPQMATLPIAAPFDHAVNTRSSLGS